MNLRGAVRSSLAVLVLLFALSAVAQAGDAGTAPSEDGEVLGLVALGVDAGFPAYRTLTARASLQSRFVGVAVRAGYGPGSGPYAGATLRGYPPLPGSPVPVWLGAGVGASAAGATPFAAAGAHVPLAQRWRLDLEAGVAWPELGPERRLAPHLSVGVSYAFPVDLTGSRRPSLPAPGSAAGAGATCAEPGPPDPDALPAALQRAVREFVADARATYGSLYDDLRYDARIAGRELAGDRAVLRVAYEGSVREIATGRRVAASGTATLRLRWTGCEWRRTGLSY